MSNSKPVINFITTNSRNDYSNRNYKGSAYINKRYDTYRELKKHIKEHLDICIETHVTVYRTRRGEWGEWFEHWTMVNP
jgi:hypothetical protein